MRRADKNRQKEENVKLANKICDALTDEEDKVYIFDEASMGRRLGKSSMAIKIGQYILDEIEKKKGENVAHERRMHALLAKSNLSFKRNNTKFK